MRGGFSVPSDASDPVVHLIDDNHELRLALSRFIQHNGLVCQEHANPGDFLREFDPESAGCVVLDVPVPGMSGLALQEELKQKGIRIPVIILSGHADVPVTLQAWRNGAFDLLQKPVSNQVLIATVRRAVAEDLRTREQRILQARIRRRVENLTPREFQVMGLVVAGNANKIIGVELGLSQKTVEVHRSHVMRKMGARSLPELVRMVMLVEDDPTELIRKSVGLDSTTV